MPPARSPANAKPPSSECVRPAEGGNPVAAPRHGRPVVALVPAEDLEKLQALRAAGPQGGLASVAGGWEGSEELAAEIDARRRSSRRAPARLD